MYRIVICDDDKDFCNSFESRLRDILDKRMIEYTIAVFYDASSFIGAMEAGECYDLVCLDVLIDGQNGIDVARSLRLRGCSFDIIFVTSSKDYAIDSFDVDSLYYLVKPVSTDKLKTALERFLKKRNAGSIRLEIPEGYLNIKLSDIVYIEINNHTISIHKADGGVETFRGTLEEMEARLPLSMFLRPHRGYLVNYEYINGFSRNGIKLPRDTIIPISKKRYNESFNKFMEYLSKGDIYP